MPLRLEQKEDRIPPPGFAALKLPFSPRFAKVLFKFPGIALGDNKFSGFFMIPMELIPTVKALCKKRGFKNPYWITRPDPCSQFNELDTFDRYLPFQQIGFMNAAAQTRPFLNFEPGLGKTPTTIAAIRIAAAMPALVICPANVRRDWKRELVKWGVDEREITIIEQQSDWMPADPCCHCGTKASQHQGEKHGFVAMMEYPGHWTITSYELASGALTNRFDSIVLDEAHKIKNSDTSFNEAVTAIRDANPSALRFCLTATPMSVDPSDIYAIVDWLFPGRFGSFWNFASRYCTTKKNDYGTALEYRMLDDGTWTCINPDHEQELRVRFNSFTARATRAEVGHLLPAFTVSTLHKRTGSSAARDYNERLNGPVTNHRELVDLALLSNAGEKAAWSVDVALDCLSKDNDHHVIICPWLRETATDILGLLKKAKQQARESKRKGERESILEATELYYVDGDVTNKKRDSIIQDCSTKRRAIMVATQASVLEGINSLTQFQTAIAAELYPSLRVMVQWLGRFSRLNSTHPSRVLLLCADGTIDERSLLRVLQRAQTASRLFEQGQSEQLLATAAGTEPTEKEIQMMLRATALGGIEDEY